MTEKEFRRLVTDLELKAEEKEVLNEKLRTVKQLIQDHISNQIECIDVIRGGSYAKATMLSDTDIVDLIVIVKPVVKFVYAVMNQAIMNEIQNIFIYYLPEIVKQSDIECNMEQNKLIVKMTDITVALCIRYPQDLSSFEKFSITLEEKQIAFIEYANRDYTYFRNTLQIIQYYRDEQQLNNITGSMIEVLLYYGLNEHFKDNRYEDYLQAFVKALEDFIAGKRIEVSQDIYQKLAVEPVALGTVKKGYTIADVANPSHNLTVSINDVSIGEFRKLKKTISKLVDTSKESIATGPVVLDIDPVYHPDMDIYAWSYQINQGAFSNQGGSFSNTQEQYYSAVLKGYYKGLRAIVDYGLNKKQIQVICKDSAIFRDAILSDENKARLKNIYSYIENNGLTISQ